MSRCRLPRHVGEARFPRVSGDEPLPGTGMISDSMFSPRERG